MWNNCKVFINMELVVLDGSKHTEGGLFKYQTCICVCVCGSVYANSTSGSFSSSSGLNQWFGDPLGWLLAPATGALVFDASDSMLHSLCGSSFSSLSSKITFLFSLLVTDWIIKHLTPIHSEQVVPPFNRGFFRKVVSTFKDTTEGDKLLINSTFLVAQRVKGVIIKVFTALSWLSSADQGDRLDLWFCVTSKLVSSSDYKMKTVWL